MIDNIILMSNESLLKQHYLFVSEKQRKTTVKKCQKIDFVAHFCQQHTHGTFFLRRLMIDGSCKYVHVTSFEQVQTTFRHCSFYPSFYFVLNNHHHHHNNNSQIVYSMIVIYYLLLLSLLFCFPLWCTSVGLPI